MNASFFDDPEYLRFCARRDEYMSHAVRIETDAGHVIERIGPTYEITTPHGDKLMNTYDGKSAWAFESVDDALFHLFDSDEEFRADMERIGNVLREALTETPHHRLDEQWRNPDEDAEAGCL